MPSHREVAWYLFTHRMKTFLIFLVVFSLHNTSIAQDVYFDWVKQLNRTQGSQESCSIGVDDNKNVYVAGGFEILLDLDPGAGVFNVTSDITSGVWDDIFVVKLDPAGNFIWGKQIAGDRNNECNYFHVDPNGDLYLTGHFSGTTDFDPGPASYPLTAIHTDGTENYDIFTMKLDSDGNFKWARSAGSLGPDVPHCITTDLSGNVYTTGYITGPVDFDPGPGVSNSGTNGRTTTFITRFDRQGNFIWAKEFTGTYNSSICIRTDNAGNVYLSGIFEGTVDFDPGTAAYMLTSTTGSGTPYLVKLNPDGNLIWAKADADGQGAYFNNDFSAFEVNATQEIITYNGRSNFSSYLSKYDINGNPVWTRLLNGRQASWPNGSSPMVLDAAGNIYLTGEFNYTSDFDPGPGTYNMTADGGGFACDAFLCRLDADGNFVWAKQFGNFAEEHPRSIAIDTSGGIYTVGTYNFAVDFDPGPAVFNMSDFPVGGMFIHKMSRCQNVRYSALDINTCSAYTLNNHTYTQSGTYIQTLPNSLGCDSIITLRLTVQNQATDISEISCDSYSWNNQVLTSSGTYTHTFTSIAGCDSVVSLHLTIRNKSLTSLDMTICEGQQYEGHSSNGVYTDVFTAANGCDSLRTLNLHVTPKKYTDITARICKGENYSGYTSSGTYVDMLTSASGCDSIRTLHLQVNTTYDLTVNKTICRGELYMGHSISGTYTDRMQTIDGCDSIQTTVLTVADIPGVQLGKDTTLCANDSLVLHAGVADSYSWQDGSVKNYFIVKAPGTYSVVATNNCGTATARIVVENNSCQVYFPSAFTPNRDGRNDKFGILNAYNVSSYHLSIYNRWGELLFESRNPAIAWDGTYKGQPLGTNVFVWQCSFKENNISKNMKGTVTLLR